MQGQRVVFTSYGDVELECFQLKPPGPSEVLLETLVSIISPGTERAFLHAEPNTVTNSVGFPFYPGYSNVGRVLSVGEDVSNVRVGEILGTMTSHCSHVLVRPPLNSPRQRGGGSLFDSSEITDFSWRLRNECNAETLKLCAAFIIAGVGLYGAQRAEIKLGDQVIVIGLGPVGLLAGQFAKLSGGLPVIGIAQTPERRHIAKTVGFDLVYANFDDCMLDRPDLSATARTVVIEATGRPTSLLSTLKFCPEGATLVLLGSTRGVISEIDFYSLIYRKALTLVGAHQPTRPSGNFLHCQWSQYWDADAALRMIVANRVHIEQLISHEFSISQIKNAYQMISDSSTSLCVALSWCQR